MTHATNVHIAAVYLAIMLLSLFGILQRVIKSEKVYIDHLDTAKVDTFVPKFADLFLNSGLTKR